MCMDFNSFLQNILVITTVSPVSPERTSTTDAAIKPACLTVESNTDIPPNTKCIFPFTYNNVIYKQCTWDSSHLTNNKPWCSGETDSKGKHVTGKRKWANCATECEVLAKRM